MAKPVLVRILGDSSSAREAVEEAREELRKFSRENAEAALEVRKDKALRDIAAVKAELERIDKAEYAPEVKIDLAERQLRKLSVLEGRLKRLDAMDVEVDVDVDRSAIDRVGAGVGVVERRIGGITGAFSNLFRAIPLFGTMFGFALRGLTQFAVQAGAAVGLLVSSFGALGRLAGPIGGIAGGVISIVGQLASLGAVAGGAVIALNAVLGAVVALGAALVALGASLTAAVGGLAALGAAFAGVLGPGILVVIGLFQRFNAILEARKAREQALEQATRDQRTADEQRTGALETLRAAQERLAEATVEGRRAMAQAAEDQEDAERSLQSARLGVQEARLNLREARAELREFLRGAGAAGAEMNALMTKFGNVDFDPSQAGNVFSQITGQSAGGNRGRELQRHILAIQRAHLNVKEAVDRVGDSERELAESRKKNAEFAERGIRAHRPYRQAVQQVARANRQYERSLDRVSAAQENYHQKLEELSGTERGTLDRVNRLLDAFKALAQAFTDPIFEAINDVFDSLSGNTGFLERGLRLVGRAFGDVVRSFGRFLGERSSRQAFTEMARGAASLARNLGASAFVSFLRIMRNIARVALPALIGGSNRFADTLRRWAAGSATAGFAATIRRLIGHFRNWLGLAKDVGLLVLEIFKGAAGAGASLVTHVRRWVREQTRLIRQNPEKVKRFFEDMITKAEDILAAIKDVAHWLKTELPDAADFAVKAFNAIGKAAKAAKDSAKFFIPILAAKEGLDRVRGKRHSGGTVGDGLYNLQRGEEVIRSQIAGRFRGQLKALNAGLPPEIAFAGGSSRTTHVTAPIHVSGGGSPDPDVLAALLTMSLRRLGA